jgi:hypothetical protein
MVPRPPLQQQQQHSAHHSPPAAALSETIVEFTNHRGERLVGTLTNPPPSVVAVGGQQQQQQQPVPPPVVILAHGYMSSRHSELLVRLSTALVRSSQLSTLRFDFSGAGGRGACRSEPRRTNLLLH